MRHLRYLTIALIISSIIAAGCKKEGSSVNQPFDNGLRLKTIVYGENSEWRKEIEYEGNRVIGEYTYVEEYLIERTEWQYVNNEVTRQSYYLIDTVWHKADQRNFMTYVDGKLVSSINQSDYKIYSKDTFIWENDLLKQNDNYSLINASDELKLQQRTKYNYSGDLITSMEYYYQDHPDYAKEVIEYENKLPVNNYSFYSSIGITATKADLLYTNNRLSRMNDYYVSNGIPGEIKSYEELNYNMESNTITFFRSEDDYSSTSVYFYEDGEGNYGDFWIAETDWLSHCLFPEGIHSHVVNEW